MFRWIPGYGHGGLVVTALAMLAMPFVVLARRRSGSPAIVYLLATMAMVPALVELVLTGWYLLSPTYIDHIEASTASQAQYFLQGVPLYPGLDSFTFHGIVYGPLLAELNSLGYLLGSGAWASKLIGWVAAWVAVGLMMAMPGSSGPRWTRAAAIAVVLCVLASFSNVLTADRADSLLLLCAAAGLFSVLRFSGLPALAVVAVLAGAAADLKLHGPLYLVPALYWWVSEQAQRPKGFWWAAVLVACVAGIVAFICPFLPANVSPLGYLTYLRLAARHGLIWREFGWNCAFLASLWAPIALLLPGTGRPDRRLVIFAGTLFAAEAVVCVIAAKPGAGLHHLLPFLGFHLFLLQRMLAEGSQHVVDQGRLERGLTAALAVVLLGTAWPGASMALQLLDFDLQLPRQELTHAELTQLSSRYPHGMLGVSDEASYDLTNFRPWLTLDGTRQTDYGALMDLKLSGVSDAPLAQALARCQIPYVFMPREGAPFSMQNRYGGPLFSSEVRAQFSQRYSLLQTGRDFDVYACGKWALR